MGEKYCKLVMVTGENNNKYYEMLWDGVSTSFTVHYGRVDLTKTTISKPISHWDSLIKEKEKKGYRNITDMVAVEVKEEKEVKLSKIEDNAVEEFLSLMKKYTAGLVDRTYSVKAVNVSQKQIDEAQKLIDELNILSNKIDEIKVNKVLLTLYMTIPRKMSNVKSYLLPNVKLENILQQEQDNLDAMASQIASIVPEKKVKNKKETKTLLDVLGISMRISPKEEYEKDLNYLLKQPHGRKIKSIFYVEKPKEDEEYAKWLKGKKDKTSKILIHGTKCTSVIPIIEIGLKIRPTGNFQFSGKAYGPGNYFSEVMQKSLNYTGWDKDKVLLVYEVHTGNPFVYDGWFKGNSFPLDLKNLSERGFDSTYVKAGNGLLNSEIIVYSENQNRLKYIIHLE